MTDRGRLVYALLRTLFNWTPTIRSRNGLDRVPRGFVHSTTRYVTCPDCLTNDRVLSTCETCEGRGVVPDPGPDPYDLGVGKGIVRGRIALSHRAAAENDVLRASKDRELELRRLEYQLHQPELRKDEIVVPDHLSRAIEARDTQYKHGSYEELEHALTKLRETRPVAYTAAMWVAYSPLQEQPVEAVRPAVIAICEELALLMDGPIRVPADVPISEDQQIERIARDGKGALWHGRSDWHELKRGERNALILAMSEAGMSATAIGLRVGLKRRRVQDVLAEQRALREGGVASGPAA